MQALGLVAVDHRLIEPLKADRLVLQHARHGVGGLVDIGKADDGDDPLGRVVDQVQGRFEHRDARALRPDERAGDVHPVLGKELVQVLVAGHAARDLGEPRADERLVAAAEFIEAAVDFAAPPARAQDRAELVLARRPDGESRGRHR